jgi:antitoxin PrlF
MATAIDVESTLTDRYQTTLPTTVRRALGIGKRDKIHYTIRANGEVVLTKATRAEGGDPVVGAFLSFLAQDMENHPEQIRSLNADLVTRIRNLTADVEVDLDQPLSADDE